MQMQASQRAQLPQFPGLPAAQADGSQNPALAQRQGHDAMGQPTHN